MMRDSGVKLSLKRSLYSLLPFVFRFVALLWEMRLLLGRRRSHESCPVSVVWCSFRKRHINLATYLLQRVYCLVQWSSYVVFCNVCVVLLYLCSFTIGYLCCFAMFVWFCNVCVVLLYICGVLQCC